MTAIADIHAREILDSRGNPTVEVEVRSTAARWAGRRCRRAPRPGRMRRSRSATATRSGIGGKGVQKAVGAVNGEIFDALIGLRCRRPARDRPHPDRARRHAQQKPARRQRHPRRQPRRAPRPRRPISECRSIAMSAASLRAPLPVPMMNIVNGGVHADNPIDIQEFMIMPVGAPTFAEALRMGSEIFHALRKQAARCRPQHQCRRRRRLRAQPQIRRRGADLHHAGDRGGRLQARRRHHAGARSAPRPNSTRTAATISKARARCSIAPDGRLSTPIWSTAIPIISIEDGMAEDDWDGWAL